MPANSPASCPSDLLVVDTTAPHTCISVGISATARISARPMRPPAPMMTAFRGRPDDMPTSQTPSGRPTREEPLHALEETLLTGSMSVRIALEGFIQLANEVPLLGRQVHRRLDDDATEQIAPRAAT